MRLANRKCFHIRTYKNERKKKNKWRETTLKMCLKWKETIWMMKKKKIFVKRIFMRPKDRSKIANDPIVFATRLPLHIHFYEVLRAHKSRSLPYVANCFTLLWWHFSIYILFELIFELAWICNSGWMIAMLAHCLLFVFIFSFFYFSIALVSHCFLVGHSFCVCVFV